MSTIERAVTIDRIEPSALSLRVVSGNETRLELSYLSAIGDPFTSDVLGQLELIGKTNNGPSLFYAVPATDIGNGLARTIIPAGVLIDPNGYRLNLYGSIQGEQQLLAMGRVDVTKAIGGEGVAPDLINHIDLTFERNENVLIDVTLWADDGGEAPYDMTMTTISAAIYLQPGGPAVMPFAIEQIAENKVRLTLTAEQVNQLPDSCWWSLIASTAEGATTLCEGKVTISGEIIPPLTTVTLNYDYQKPATDADPASGEIIHGNQTINVLKVSTTDHDVLDALPTLELLKVGDTITIGATVWSIAYIVPGVYWQLGIAPLEQAVETGVVPVTFMRPEI